VRDIQDLDTLKEYVLNALKQEIQNGNDKINIGRRASGSASGLPFEEWTKEAIENYAKKNNIQIKVFLQEEFLREVVDKLKNRGYTTPQRIENFLYENTWWGLKPSSQGQHYFFSKRQLEDAIAGRDVRAYQQSIADLVVFYGDDLIADINKIVAINVKSHDLGKHSRHPNIVSAKRLLEYFNDILEKNPSYLDDFELWFIGIYYERRGSYAHLSQNEVYLRDLFKLKISEIPVINFDAAIQLQWHIKEMEEDPSQTKEDFIKNLAVETQKRWKEFSEKRTEVIDNLVGSILEKL